MIEHYPVLYREVLYFFRCIDEGYVVDTTVGGGGHSYLLLRQSPNIKIIGIDRDDYALSVAGERLSEFSSRVVLTKSAFADLDIVLSNLGIDRVAGFLFDLGVSHFHLKLERGFSFQREEFLDMRMDRSQRLTAYDVVNTFPQQELYRIIRDYGEEKFARQISQRIVQQRKKKRIETTKELADIVYSVYPPKLRHSLKIHPATKTFQGIRIYINDELNQIETALRKTLSFLQPGGLIAVISFHSLEDRIVKSFFKKQQELKVLEILTKKPVTPSEQEIKENPASRSGKLRVARRI